MGETDLASEIAALRDRVEQSTRIMEDCQLQIRTLICQRDDVAMLLKRLCAASGRSLDARVLDLTRDAMEYLRRQGLQGSVLR